MPSECVVDARHYFFVGRNYTRLDLSGRDLRGVNFTCANFRGADLSGSDLRGAVFVSADLSRADLHGCDARGADFSAADLTGADVVRAEMLGARFDGAITTGLRNVDRAIWRWFMPPAGGKPVYDPFPGALVLEESATGTESHQENAGMGVSGRGYLNE